MPSLSNNTVLPGLMPPPPLIPPAGCCVSPLFPYHSPPVLLSACCFGWLLHVASHLLPYCLAKPSHLVALADWCVLCHLCCLILLHHPLVLLLLASPLLKNTVVERTVRERDGIWSGFDVFYQGTLTRWLLRHKTSSSSAGFVTEKRTAC